MAAPLDVVAWFARHHGLDERVAQGMLNSIGYAVEWKPLRVAADAVFALCQSPLERLYLVGVQHLQTNAHAPAGCLWWRTGDGLMGLIEAQPKVDTTGLAIHPDFKWSIHGSNTRLYVEIDGHAFHAATKEQVTRDRRRERAIVANGEAVVRFTGSEVHADPVGCAKESLEILRKINSGSNALCPNDGSRSNG